MSPEYDVALVAGDDMTAHALDCPEVKAARDAGAPLMTMMGCARPLPEDVVRHECMARVS